jgi:hypothetical protein
MQESVVQELLSLQSESNEQAAEPSAGGEAEQTPLQS